MTVNTKLKRKKKDHFEVMVTSLSHLRDIAVIHVKLTMRQWELFRQTYFGNFLDLDPDLVFSGTLVHHMILHEVQMHYAEQELWYCISGNTTTFSQVEFALVTNLRVGPFPNVAS